MATDQKPHSRRKFILLVLFVFLVGGLTFHIISERAAEKAWDEYKIAAAARGESMDWDKYVPVPPPDSENVYAAPVVRKWIPEKGEVRATPGGKILTQVKAKEADRAARLT